MYRPAISRPVCTWKGRPHLGLKEREGDTCASRTDKGKRGQQGAEVGYISARRLAGYPDPIVASWVRMMMHRRATHNLIQ